MKSALNSLQVVVCLGIKKKFLARQQAIIIYQKNSLKYYTYVMRGPSRRERVIQDSIHITLFITITMFCGTDSILQNIPHIWIECEKYFAKYCQSHRTLLWI